MQWLVSAEPADAVAEWIDGAGGQTSCASYAEPDPDETPLHVRLRCDALGPVTFYVEGVSPRGTMCDAECTIQVNPCVDLDVDSNNDHVIDPVNGPGGSDDPIEAADFSATTPGKWLWVNNDDTDGNLAVDCEGADADHINGPTDVKDVFPLVIRPTPASQFPEGSRLFLETTNANALRVFGCHAGGCTEVWLGPGLPVRAEIGLSSIERTFGIEGVVGGHHVRLRLELEDALGNLICEDELGVTVVRVATVEWQAYGDNTPLDSCPNNDKAYNPSRRIFPDRQAHVDPNETDRAKVLVKTVIVPSVRDVRVYVRTWDVGDPTEQYYGAFSNPPLNGPEEVDNDWEGPDNRRIYGGDPGVIEGSFLTDETGAACYEMSVSMQPGNNYRGGASCMIDGMDDEIVIQADADANIAPLPVEFSEMLTVWRKVWLELDSMTFGTDISFTGSVAAIFNGNPHPPDGTAKLTVGATYDRGRFEGGKLTVTPQQHTYDLIDNVDETYGRFYRTAIHLVLADEDRTATAVDDDRAVLRRTPNVDIALLDVKYKYCYIRFYEDMGTRDNNVPFASSLHWGDMETTGFSRRDHYPASDHWHCTIVLGHQFHVPDPGQPAFSVASIMDGDPDVVFHNHLGTPVNYGDQAILSAISHPTLNCVFFFLEANLDYSYQVSEGKWQNHPIVTIDWREPRTIAHEIGHQLGFFGHIPGTLINSWGPGSENELFINGLQVDTIRGSGSLDSDYE